MGIRSVTVHSLEVRHFQSLHHVEIEVAPLTVIIGPSSSGKSALTRAIRTLYANRRGADFIEHGERIASITARTDKGTVTLTRGKGTDDNAYVVTPSDPGHPLAPQAKYTKLGGETPPEVTQFLGIDGKDPVSFASQFDKPYLLDDSPAEVARTMGALTNVDVIFSASREANRQRLHDSQILKTRSADLETIKEKIPAYRALKEQAAHLTEAEGLIERARTIQSQIDALSTAARTLAIAESHIETTSQALDIVVPDEKPLVEAHQKLTALTQAVRAWGLENRRVAEAEALLDNATVVATEAGIEWEGALADIGDGFLSYFRHHGHTWPINDGSPEEAIDVEQAATLAAQYIASFLKE